MINHRENETLLSYEPTIKYASFPALDLYGDVDEPFGKGPFKEHKEVFAIFEWLKKFKGVTSILDLQVPDRLFSPHNELTIADYVEELGVETFNWRYADMSLSTFKDESKGRIKVLHLYSSGKRAAISHWLSEDGLASFKKVCEA